jgi:23S rRNA (uracil1939-C5)-methyltransferase
MEITLTNLVYGGDAMGRLPDGRAVFVPYALPGERVRICLVDEKRGYAKAVLLEVLQPSPERIAPLCPHFTVCGGCHYQHLTYARQLEYKTHILREQLQRVAGIENPPLQSIIPSPAEWNYRNAIQLHPLADGRLGYQKAGSHTVVAVTECHLPQSPLDECWKQIEVEPLEGLERVELRQGEGEELLLALHSANPTLPEFNTDFPISAVFLSPQGQVVLAGEDTLEMQVLDRPFRVSAGSFFQVNTAQAGNMVQHLLDQLSLTGKIALLEVYCGVGLFSAFLAPHCSRLAGVELSESACEDFAYNLDEFNHVELYQGAAEDILPALNLKPQVILVDPPRAGVEHRALQALLVMAPEVIAYISCDPATLARDARHILAAGYVLEQVTPLDMFPQTFHIESISIFRRKP